MYVNSILPQTTLDPSKPIMKKGKPKPLLTCDVCSEKGSGVKGHYDRNLCNGCRAFVKRVVKKTIIVALCTGDMKCSVKCYDRYRIKCRDCRFMQCFNVGVNFTKIEAFNDLSHLEQKGLLAGILPRRTTQDEATPTRQPPSRSSHAHYDKENIRRDHAHFYFSTGQMMNTPSDFSISQMMKTPSDLSVGRMVNTSSDLSTGWMVNTQDNFSDGRAVKTEPSDSRQERSVYLKTNAHPNNFEPVPNSSLAFLNYNMFGSGPCPGLGQNYRHSVPTSAFSQTNSFNGALISEPILSNSFQSGRQFWQHDNCDSRNPLNGPFLVPNQSISQNDNGNELDINHKLSPVMATTHSSNQTSRSDVRLEEQKYQTSSPELQHERTIYRSNSVQGHAGEGHSASREEPIDLTNKSNFETKSRHFNSTANSRSQGFQPPTIQNKAFHDNVDIMKQTNRTTCSLQGYAAALPGYNHIQSHFAPAVSQSHVAPLSPNHVAPMSPGSVATMAQATHLNDPRSPTFIKDLTHVYSNFLASQQIMYNQMLASSYGQSLPSHATEQPYFSYNPVVHQKRAVFVNHDRNVTNSHSNSLYGSLTKPYPPDHETNVRRQGHERSDQGHVRSDQGHERSVQGHGDVNTFDTPLCMPQQTTKRPRDQGQGRYSASPSSSISDTDQDIPSKIPKGCSNAETSVVSLEGNDSGIDGTFSSGIDGTFSSGIDGTFSFISSSSLLVSDTKDDSSSPDSSSLLSSSSSLSSLSPDTTIQVFITDKPSLKRGTGFMVRDLFAEAESNSENHEDQPRM